jgi:hypothetical protein
VQLVSSLRSCMPGQASTGSYGVQLNVQHARNTTACHTVCNRLSSTRLEQQQQQICWPLHPLANSVFVMRVVKALLSKADQAHPHTLRTLCSNNSSAQGCF